MYPPTDDVREAQRTLGHAATLFVEGDLSEAERLIRQADPPALLAYFTECTNNRKRPLARERRPVLPKSERIETRMPSPRSVAVLYERDGWHCRFCGIGVVDKRAQKKLTAKLPEAARWGPSNASRHSGMLVLMASPDHVIPHSHGGDNSMDNMVTACFLCQFSRGEKLLDEVGVSDPRLRLPILDDWDGLMRVR